VICQHSHCPGCSEDYAGGHIVYGQGNLIFDSYPHRQETWCKGYLVSLSIKLDSTSEMEIIPYIQSDARIGARRLEKNEEENFRRDLENQSALIRNDDFVEKQWKYFCEKYRYPYFSGLRGHNRLVRGINKLFHFSDIFYSKNSLLTLQNVIRCEAHREVIETILSDIR